MAAPFLPGSGFLNFVWELLLALLVALPIGFEREKARKFAGFRTSLLITSVGFFSSLFAGVLGATWIIGIGFLFATSVAVVMYYARSRRERHPGLTTSMVFVLLFCLGVLVNLGFYFEAIASSILVTFLLSAKPFTKSLVRNLTEKELVQALVLGFSAFIVLPLLPNRTVDPWGLFNPFLVWTMAVFILATGFIGYVAMKAFGSGTGAALAGLIGGFVSSAAVTFSMAPGARNNRHLLDGAALAVTMASSIVFLRILIIVFIGSKRTFDFLLFPLLSLAAVGVFLSVRKAGDLGRKTPFDSGDLPRISMWPAFRFSVIFAAILVAFKFLFSTFGDYGIYAAAALTGFLSLNALAVSALSLASAGALPARAAAVSILIGCASTCGGNLFFSYRLGGGRFGQEVSRTLLATILLCAAFVLALLMLP